MADVTATNAGNGESMDSTAAIILSEDKMIGYLTITPPLYGGRDLTVDDIKRVIYESVIDVDVDMKAIEDAVVNKKYNDNIPIAKGTAPVDGINGSVNYRFSRTGALTPKRNDRDEMDYKDLGLVQNVVAGTVIADIVAETLGEDGKDVCGIAHKPMPGNPPKYLVGKGTAVNEDKTAIIAAVDGNLKWAKDNFSVEEVLVIPEDVGATTGNIDFIGTVQVNGNVLEGFTIESKKNVEVRGSVNNATIIAGGNIDVKLGCVNSEIKAKGNVKIGFCESSKIECADITSNSFVACDIFSTGTAFATNGKGVIVGGNITCLKGMVFNVVGSESYTKTRLTLGNGALLTEEKQNLETEEAKITEEIGKLVQRCTSIKEVKRKKTTIPRELEDVLATSIRTRFKLANDIKLIKKRIAQIEASYMENAALFIEVRKAVWPGVTVRIGTSRKKIDNKDSRCRISLDNTTGEIVIKGITGAI